MNTHTLHTNRSSSRFAARAGGARYLGRRSGQRGVALVIALLLLVLITLVGFAAVRGTIVQQKMSSNMYDREVAFQSAEAALRAAAALVAANPGLVARDCEVGTTCYANPFVDPLITSKDIHTVSSGTTSGYFTTGTNAASSPQYVIENMGAWVDQSTTATNFDQTANSRNYGVQGSSTAAQYYRITARSSDPATTSDRAIVTLQAMLKQS